MTNVTFDEIVGNMPYSGETFTASVLHFLHSAENPSAADFRMGILGRNSNKNMHTMTLDSSGLALIQINFIVMATSTTLNESALTLAIETQIKQPLFDGSMEHCLRADCSKAASALAAYQENYWKWVVICNSEEFARTGICVSTSDRVESMLCDYDTNRWNEIYESLNIVIWFWIVEFVWANILIVSLVTYATSFCLRYYTVLIHKRFLGGSKQLTLSPVRAAIALGAVRVLYYIVLQYGARQLSSRTCAETAISKPLSFY